MYGPVNTKLLCTCIQRYIENRPYPVLNHGNGAYVTGLKINMETMPRPCDQITYF